MLPQALGGGLGAGRAHAGLLLLCALGAAAAMLPQALVGHVAQLYALRFATGLFLAGVLPSACGLAAHLSPVERRGAANGFMFSAIGLANAAGPLLGGVLAASVGLRLLFVVAGGVLLAGCIGLRIRSARFAIPPARADA